jgi:uncharacterized protein YecE (DUF72 family)
MTMKEGLKKLQTLPLDKRFRYAIEPRQESWFDGEVYSFLRKNDICLAWTQQNKIQTPPVVTTDFIYLRFIGDRSINEKDFGVIHKNREKELQNWAGVIKKIKAEGGFVPANNHYAGFGPATANIFRKMVGMKPVVWEEIKQATLD